MSASLPCPPELTLARLSVAQYHAMRDGGILSESDDVELLEGLLVPKMTKLPPHSVACTLVKECVESVLPRSFHLRVQDPVTTPDSEPEPDLAVVRGHARDYLSRHPGAADVPLVIEVADDSLARDRGTKLRIYARAGIVEYWILNLRDRCIERHQNPENESYRSRESIQAGARIPLMLDGAVVDEIEVDAMLP